MKAIEILSQLCTECIDLQYCYVYNGEDLLCIDYTRLFPINRNSTLDEWFNEEYDYFCAYAKKDSDYCFLKEPDCRVDNIYYDDEEIHFWKIEK